MKLHTVVISYKRRNLTEQALRSFMDTVSVEHTLVVVDNGSEQETQDWLASREWALGANHTAVLLGENRYPGYACNRGFELAPDDATHLHRADNDFIFRPGWCEEVIKCFEHTPRLGQLGLRTDAEEMGNWNNVGGNMVLRRDLWDDGLRYDERPWPEYEPGWSEDGYMSPAVKRMGWEWGRVHVPCIEPTGTGDWQDPYYQESFGARHITPRSEDPTA